MNSVHRLIRSPRLTTGVVYHNDYEHITLRFDMFKRLVLNSIYIVLSIVTGFVQRFD